MPTVKPFFPSDTLLKLEFTINGEITGLDTLLTEAKVHFELNKIPFAKFTFATAEEDFEDNDDSPLHALHHEPTDPPLEIEVKISFEGAMETLFKGVIKSLDQQYENCMVVAKIECKDVALRLSQSSTEEENNNQTFEEKLTNYTTNLILSDNLQGQSWGEEEITHNNTTVPWDYLIGFLDSIGMMVALRNSEFVGIDILQPESEPIYVAENGINVFAFTGRLDAERRKSAVTIERWDIENQETVTVSASQSTPDNPHTVRLSETQLQEATLQRVADTIIAKSNLAAITGKVTTFGNLLAKSGDYITFTKVNTQINDEVLLITQEEHSIQNGCWKTEYMYGLESERSFTQNTTSGVNNTHAEIGQTNTVNGLQIGIVTKIIEDPNNQFRIKVRIPQLSSSGEGVWARLGTLNASSDMGSYFIPSINDEVIVGCLNNNPDTPIILGSLYSSNKAMPYPIEENNYKKGFVTKEGTRILMDDEKKSIEVSTKKGNKLLISDDLKGFVLEDENKNKITMNDQGITIESCKDLNMKAKGNIKVEGININAEGSGNMILKGTMINLN
ncbi:phage baseplate assembly protein V [Flavobacterium sp. HNIBRBA15423]|uniref:phage baseplate assembly protein V n=1 Tax=Flavobacterium sp. HNIBRBA15423 TaxID=3458683 RepID=UPI004044FAE1